MLPNDSQPHSVALLFPHLLRNPRLPKPIFVDLGPDGEWFVSYADGSYRWGGNSDETDEALAHAQAEGRVKRVLFGERDAYLIAYE